MNTNKDEVLRLAKEAEKPQFNIGDRVITTDSFKREGVIQRIYPGQIKKFNVVGDDGKGGMYGFWEIEKAAQEAHVERAKEQVANWPAWKRDFQLTKHSAAQEAEPKNAQGLTETQRLQAISEHYGGTGAIKSAPSPEGLAQWLHSINDDGYRTDDERCAARLLLPIAQEAEYRPDDAILAAVNAPEVDFIGIVRRSLGAQEAERFWPEETVQAIRAKMAQEAEKPQGYVQTVPDHCDRIVWRGHYYALPLQEAAREQPAKAYCGGFIELRYGSTKCGADFHGSLMQCDACEAKDREQPADERKDAQDAARWRAFRSLINVDDPDALIGPVLDRLFPDLNIERKPTPEEVDAVGDGVIAALAQQSGKEQS